jgi:hypothetical protein
MPPLRARLIRPQAAALVGAFVWCAAPAAAQVTLRGPLDPAGSLGMDSVADPANPGTPIAPSSDPTTFTVDVRTPPDAPAYDFEVNRFDAPRAGIAKVEPVSVPTGDPRRASQPRPIKGALRDAAFDPIGSHVGSFLVKPTLDADIGFDSNALRVAGSPSSRYLAASGDVQIESLWSRHAFTADLRGSYTDYLDIPDADAPRFSGDAALRLDLSRIARADIAARAVVDTERLSDPNLPAGLSKRPVTFAYGATVGTTIKPNRLGFTLEGLADRFTYEPLQFSNGSQVSSAQRNFNAYEARLRSAYELSPALQPFVELGANTRVHDTRLDASGIARDSVGTKFAAGARFEPSPAFVVEAKAGYAEQDYDSPVLPTLSGATIDGSVIWRPSALTTVTLTGTTSLDETTLPNSSGALTRTAKLAIAHAFRRYLIATGSIGYSRSAYNGIGLTDELTSADLALEWRLTRSVAVRVRGAYEQLASNGTGRDYEAKLIEIGLRLRR